MRAAQSGSEFGRVLLDPQKIAFFSRIDARARARVRARARAREVERKGACLHRLAGDVSADPATVTPDSPPDQHTMDAIEQLILSSVP